MKILFVSGYDSMNYTLAECAKEAIRRGHEAIVIVKDAADLANCGMYERRSIAPVSLSDFDYSLLDGTDIVFTAPVKPYYYKELFDEIHKRRLFICAFAALFSSVVMREYPDLVFCLGDAKAQEFDRYALKYSCVSIGNPQYDALLDHRRKRNDDPGSIRRVLIVDQGGYPYGKDGKEELAKTLKAIARNDPERIYEIKQRYNGKKAFSATHEIPESLAEHMTDLPENLRFLETDKELEELLPGYDAMITTWSTAFIDAIVMNIPLVLISGLPSEDRFDVRRQRIEEAYEDLKGTGCLRDYRSLRQGRIIFSYADEEYKKRLLYDASPKSAPRVLDAAQTVFEKVIGRGLRINEVIRTDYEGFISGLGAIDTVRADDPDYILKRKYLIGFNDEMQEWVYINRCMGNVLDLSALKKFYEPGKEASDLKLKQAKEEFQRARDVFFTSENGKAQAGSDRVLQDFYFDWLYERGMQAELMKPEIPVLAPESRYYNLCLYELDKGNTKEGLKYLGAFLNTVYEGKSSDLLKYKRFAQNMLRVFKKTGPARFALFAVGHRHLKMIRYFKKAIAPGKALAVLFTEHKKHERDKDDIIGFYDTQRQQGLDCT